MLALVGGGGFGAGRGARQFGDAFDTGDLHLVVDGGGADVERAAEDEGKTEDVVDLVREIRAAGRDDGGRCDFTREVGHDFGRGVGEREDDRGVCHFAHHLGREHAGAGEAEKKVGAFDDIVQRGRFAALRIGRFLGRHVVFAALVDKTGDVAEPDVLAFDAELQQHVQAGDPCRAATRGNDLDILEGFSGDMQRVGGCRADDDGGAVLVVVKDGDVHALATVFFNDEAVGCLDVFKVDRAEGGFQRADDFGKFLGVFLVQLDVEAVDIGEFLEENRLALHHGFGGKCADVAKAEDRGAVGYHGDEVAARGVAARIQRVGLDFQASLGDAR